MDDFEGFYEPMQSSVVRMPKAGRGKGSRSSATKAAANIIILDVASQSEYRITKIGQWLRDQAKLLETEDLKAYRKRAVIRRDFRGDRVGSIFLRDPGNWTKRGAKRIADWMRKKADDVQLHQKLWDRSFHARYLVE